MRTKLSLVCKKLCQLLECRVPLIKSFDALLEEEFDVEMRPALERIRRRLMQGTMLWEVLPSDPSVNSPLMEAMLRSCENDARLIEGLRIVANGLDDGTIPLGNTDQGTVETAVNPEDISRERLIQIMQDAHNRKASDIHLIPTEKETGIWLRIDGRLTLSSSVSPKEYGYLVHQAKMLARLDISRNLFPQDGRIKHKISGDNLEMRISFLPTVTGEKITIRILDPGKITLDPSVIFQRDQELQAFDRILSQPFGLILFTGPTGSGKTTTVYSALKHLADKGGCCICTVEDPVEYVLEGVSHVPLKIKQGFGYTNAIQAVLRNDPDILYVSEIRDLETLDLSLKVAVTGHLVLTSLHTLNPLESIQRLLDLGSTEPHMVASALSSIVSQRLVRKVCKECSEEVEAPNSIISEFDLDSSCLVKKANGCPSCNQTGYRGRKAVYDFLEASKELKDAIRQNNQVLIASLVSHSMTVQMKDSFRLMLEKQETTPEEVQRLQSS